MAQGANRVFRKNLTTVFGLRKVQDAAQESKGGVGLCFTVLRGNFQMAFGNHGGRDVVDGGAVPGLKIDLEVALVVVLGAVGQLANRLKGRVGVRERRHSCRQPAWIDATFHVLENIARFLSCYFGRHSRVGANRVPNSLALYLRFREEGLLLPAYAETEAG